MTRKYDSEYDRYYSDYYNRYYSDYYNRYYSEWDTRTRYDVCPYCDGTGHAPSTDNRTPCGFCHGG